MKTLLKFYLPTAFLLLGSACTDLEEIIEDDTDLFHRDRIVICHVGNPIYDVMRFTGTASHGSYYSIQEITSDEMVITTKGGDWFDGGNHIRLHQHTYGPDHPFINFTWRNTYSAIDGLNSFLRFERRNEDLIAQATALRAYLYWRLLDCFGRVKLVTEEAPDPPQVSRREVFDFIEGELLKVLEIPEVSAAMDLSDSPLAADGSAYVMNRYGALGLLAKLYLNAEVYTGIPMYDKAEIAASHIIDSGQYSLCGAGCAVRNLGRRPALDQDPEMLEGYAAVFAPNNAGNPEHIFSLHYDETTCSGMNFGQMNLHPASQLTYNFKEQPWNGYATLEEFYNSYDDADARKTASFLVGPQLDFGGSAILDFQADDDELQVNYTPQINELAPNSLRQAGARPAKFSYKQLGQPDMDNDFPIVRLGEMYLIRAEARARQAGNWALAEPDVNVLRARAGVPAYQGNLTEDEFLAERGREMFQEAARRTDLIRFGRYNDAWWEKPVSEPFRNLFPIPQAQIVAAGGSLTQNPGY
jgi:hypothetical protein